MDKTQRDSQSSLQNFFDQMQGLMDNAYTALARHNLSELQQIATEIRSTANARGELLIQVQAQLLEQAAHLQQWQRVANLLEKIRTSLERLGLAVTVSGNVPASNPEHPEHPLALELSDVKRLGSYLVEAELLTPDQVDLALADQKLTGMRFGEIIAHRGWVKQGTIEFLMQKVILPERQKLLKQMTAQWQAAQKLEPGTLEPGAKGREEAVNAKDTVFLDPGAEPY